MISKPVKASKEMSNCYRKPDGPEFVCPRSDRACGISTLDRHNAHTSLRHTTNNRYLLKTMGHTPTPVHHPVFPLKSNEDIYLHHGLELWIILSNLWDVVAPWLDDGFQPEGLGFDSRSSRHVGTWTSPLPAVACVLRRETPIQYPTIRAVVGSASE